MNEIAKLLWNSYALCSQSWKILSYTSTITWITEAHATYSTFSFIQQIICATINARYDCTLNVLSFLKFLYVQVISLYARLM